MRMKKGDEGRVVEVEEGPPKMVVGLKVNPGEEAVAVAVAEPWLKTKNNESLIPPKRRLVKKMMFDCILHFTASLFSVQGCATSSGDQFPDKGSGCSKEVTPPNFKAKKNDNKIFHIDDMQL